MNSFVYGGFIKTDPSDTQLRAVHVPTNTESSTGPSFGKRVNKLRFLATIPRFSVLDNNFRSCIERCEFAMGIGPCGRFVKGLWFDISANFLIITQESYAVHSQAPYGPPEFKEFTYLITDITGRIEAVSI